MTMCMYVPGTYYDYVYVCTRYILCLCVCMYQVHIMSMCFTDFEPHREKVHEY